MHATKIIGTRDPAATPESSLKAALGLQRIARRLGKWDPPRGFVVKGRTWEEAEAAWKEKVRACTRP